MKIDRRLKKTKEAIYEALIALLKKKDLRKIRVQELCDLADIHRATFYYHYQDIYDLYEKIEAETIAGVMAIISEAQTYQEIYAELAASIKKNLAIWQMLLSEQATGHFYQKICRAVEEKYLAIWHAETGKEDFSRDFRLLASTSVAAFVAALVKWIQSGCPEDNMAAILNDLDDAFDAVMDKYL